MARFFYYSLILFVLCSCAQDEISAGKSVVSKNGDYYIQLLLNLPDLQSSEAGDPSTRAMNDKAERMIEPEKLNILVFKHDVGTGSETYVYKAPVSGKITYDEGDATKAKITVKLIKSQPGEQFRMVLVANQDLSSVSFVTGVSLKDDVLKELTYTVSGNWKADDDDYTAFPMWGESGLLTVDETISEQVVNLYRALARIDVGLNFSTENGTLSETAIGLDYFKLKEVKVYRTYNKGYVAPLNSSMESYLQPYIPGSLERYADDAPLNYVMVDEGGANQYVREIYIPEVELPATPKNDNMHCLVIGGYYKGSSSVTYYRLDFATEDVGTGKRTYMPVLRNHRYVFNIHTVRGPGFTTPEAALQSEPTIENMDYDLILWEEHVTILEVQGKYYLGLQQKNVLLDSGYDKSSAAIFYQTNLPYTEVTLEWGKGDGAPFRINNHFPNGRFIISTKSENTTNRLLEDTLFVKAGPFSIPLLVEQKYVNFKYTLNCSLTMVSGIYLQGRTLDPAQHRIRVQLNAEDETIIGQQYVIETEDLEGDHGIHFSATGTFSSTTELVWLAGSGTLNHNADEGPFKLRIKTNSSSGSYCEATINSIQRKMKVFVLGNGDSYGYNIALPNTGSNKVLTSPNNFGPNDDSIVKTEGFELINAFLNNDMPNTVGGQNTLRANLLGTNPVDILYITQDTYIQPQTAEIIAQYLDRNGVVLVFNEGNGGTPFYTTAANIMNACFGVSNITQIQQGGIAHSGITSVAGLVYLLSGNQEELNDPYLADPILNGPFGDVRGKFWGEDASYAALLENLPTDEIITYSNGMPVNGSGIPADRTNMVSAFRHKTKNLLYFGDGGFTSSGAGGIPTITFSATLCPFNWNTSTMFPIPHPSYGAYSAQMEVYNSQVWCNAMAWAIDRAASHGINAQ